MFKWDYVKMTGALAIRVRLSRFCGGESNIAECIVLFAAGCDGICRSTRDSFPSQVCLSSLSSSYHLLSWFRYLETPSDPGPVHPWCVNSLKIACELCPRMTNANIIMQGLGSLAFRWPGTGCSRNPAVHFLLRKPSIST